MADPSQFLANLNLDSFWVMLIGTWFFFSCPEFDIFEISFTSYPFSGKCSISSCGVYQPCQNCVAHFFQDFYYSPGICFWCILTAAKFEINIALNKHH